MVDYRKLLPLIDSCRASAQDAPRADDLADPMLAPLAEELAADPAARALFARARELDAQLRQGVVQVPVPAGLAERILARLAEQAEPLPSVDAALNDVALNTAAKSDVMSVDDPLVALPPTAPVERRHWGTAVWSRRYWIAGALSAAAGLALVVNWYSTAPHYSPEQLLEVARQFDAGLPHAGGNLVSISPAPQALPMSRRILGNPQTRWHNVGGFLGRRGVAYELRTPEGVEATLYVVRIAGLPNAPQIESGRLPAAPPSAPQPASGGASMAAWQEQGRLYVLVVRGDEQAYRRLLKPSPAIAWRLPDLRARELLA